MLNSDFFNIFCTPVSDGFIALRIKTAIMKNNAATIRTPLRTTGVSPWVKAGSSEAANVL